MLGIHGNTPQYSTRQAALSISDLALPGLEGICRQAAKRVWPLRVPFACVRSHISAAVTHREREEDTAIAKTFNTVLHVVLIQDSRGLHGRCKWRLSSAVSTGCGEFKGCRMLDKTESGITCAFWVTRLQKIYRTFHHVQPVWYSCTDTCSVLISVEVFSFIVQVF